MKKILFLAENLSYGGAQKMLTFVANNLDRSLFKVYILNEAEDIPVARELNNDIEVISHNKYNRRWIRRFEELIFLSKTIKQLKPDAVVSFLNMPNFIASVAGRFHRIPVIISERGDPSRNNGISDKLMRLFECGNAGAVFQTQGAMKFYPLKIQKKAAVIPNPVLFPSINKKFSYNLNIRRIAFVGRFENVQKRQDLMVNAFANICDSVDIELHFYGDGVDESQIKEQVAKLNLENKIIFHGKVDDVINSLMDNDIYVISSDYEGIPNTLIEAMSIGMPCIATDCTPGGAALLIKNNVNGILVPRNDTKALSDAILRFVHEPALAKHCGLEATKICLDYEPSKIIKMWNDYIIDILKEN